MSRQPPKKGGATVHNFYANLPKEFASEQRTYKNYDAYRLSIPNQMLICGATGSGKTNILMNIVFGMACWSRIYLIAADLEEPLYRMLIAKIKEIEKDLGYDILFTSTTLDDLPDIDSFDKSQNNLLIIDDMITASAKKLKEVAAFWTRGRKKFVTTVFLSQSYFETPKLLRSNTKVFIFKTLQNRDLKLILKEFSQMNITVDQLFQMYESSEPRSVNNFFMVDISSSYTEPELMFRHNFTPIQQ